MTRRLRLESPEGIYHVLNRGNYRADLFCEERTKAAFLSCLGETCDRTGWRVHAWCLMSNHYHLAISTPKANLADGMQWFQGTFATRFNRLRQERGHLFQGRYKSMVVESTDGLGRLCHYIHLNPIRAELCPISDLPRWRWSSVRWLFGPRRRQKWYEPAPALIHAGELVDDAAGRRRYLDYLAWLAEDEPSRKQQKFAMMSRGWIIGGRSFAKKLIEQHRGLVGQGPRKETELRTAREEVWQDELERLLVQVGHTVAELTTAGKSVDWKLAVAAALKAQTTVTNRWLAQNLWMGNRYEVSRKVGAWLRQPDPDLLRKIS